MKKISELFNKKLFNKRTMKYGMNATLLTVSFIAILVIINLIVGNFDLKADITKNKMYSLSDQTKEILQNLDKPVNVYLLYQQGIEDPLIQEILDRYTRLSKHIKTEIVDPVKNPGFVKQFDKDGSGVSRDSIIFASENNERFKIITSYDLVNYNYQTGTADSLKAEESFTSAIMYVSSDDIPTVYFTQGHSEKDLSAAKKILEKENYQSKELNLLTENIPEDAGLIVIASPQRDFSAEEIEKLDQYFDQGGRAAFLFDVSQVELPKLESYLQEWGVGLNKDLVMEGNQNRYYQIPPFLIPEMQSHTITNRLRNDGLFMFVPYARSLDILFKEQRSTKVTPLLNSSSESWAKANLESQTIEKEADDESGPFDIAVVVTRENYEVGKDTKLLIMGNTTFLDQQFLAMPNIANTDFFMNSVNWMQDKEQNITIRPKSLRSEQLTMTQNQILFNAALVILIIPIIVFILGGFVWLRRRHL